MTLYPFNSKRRTQLVQLGLAIDSYRAAISERAKAQGMYAEDVDDSYDRLDALAEGVHSTLYYSPSIIEKETARYLKERDAHSTATKEIEAAQQMDERFKADSLRIDS